MTALVGHTLDHDAWLAERRKSIGASESAIVLGVSPYKGPLALYLEKTGQLEPGPRTDVQRIGLLMEPVLRTLYGDHVGGFDALDEPRGQVFRRSDRWPWLAATFDLLRPDGRPVELKWSAGFAGRDAWGDAGTDEVPEHYLVQCQHQLAVADRDEMDLAALVGGRFRVFTIRREPGLVDLIVGRCRAFWERVEAGDPDPAWTRDAAPRELAALYPPTGETFGADPEMEELVGLYEERSAELRIQQEWRENLRGLILAKLQGRTAVLDDGRTVRPQVVRVAERTQTIRAHEQVRLAIARPKGGRP